MDHTHTHPRPLPADLFEELWQVVGDFNPADDMPARMRQMAGALPLFLNQATLWVWYSRIDVFPALGMSTDHGLRWGLPSGKVSGCEQEVLGLVSEHLRDQDLACLPARSIDALKKGLPSIFNEGPWTADLYQSLGVGMILERTVPSSQLCREDILKAMAGFSCHPYWGQKIFEDLKKHGQRITTVTAQLGRQIPQVDQALAPLGVRASRTWVKPGAGNSQLPSGVEPGYSDFLARRGIKA